jgi:hypothetical protein
MVIIVLHCCHTLVAPLPSVCCDGGGGNGDNGDNYDNDDDIVMMIMVMMITMRIRCTNISKTKK